MALAEQYTPPITEEIATNINEAAAAQGITIEPDRLLILVTAAEHIQERGVEPGLDRPRVWFDDPSNDIEIIHTTSPNHSAGIAARVHFTPRLPGEEDELVGAMAARPKQATRFASMAIRGLQNYALLVDAGVVEKPDILFGKTNPEMAIIAERLGMLSDVRRNSGSPSEAHAEMRQMPSIEVYGSFDEIRERLFSDDIKRLERTLARRLVAEERLGAAAL